MKQSRVDTETNGMGLKGRMRRFNVIAGRRPLDVTQKLTDWRGRKWVLHPTKGWRHA